jgi:hypothetical protein
MTATAAPVRPAPGAARAAPLAAARLLRIELRRNPMPLILPLIAALFWFDSYRPSTSQAPLWVLRTFWNMGQGHTIIDFGPFVAGVAAWAASRDARRGLADLVNGTPRPRWTAQLAGCGATAIWAVAAYLIFTGVMFAVYARQGLQGSPPWWWVAVGATAVIAFSAAGFAVGVVFPSRFAAPLAAFGGFLAMMLSSQTGFQHTSGWALILPTNSNGNFQQDSGIFYRYLPDLPIARIIFLAGLALAALGAIGLAPRAGGPALRRTAAAVVLAGLLTAGTAIGLTETARLTPQGMEIPALHDAAADQPIPYIPACNSVAGVPVCLNPAYRAYQPVLAAALRPVLAAIAGLPGAPSRVDQIAASYSPSEGQAGEEMTIAGRPAVLRMALGSFYLPGSFGSNNDSQFVQQVQILAVHAFISGAGRSQGTLAQQAVQAALLQVVGLPLADQPSALASIGVPGWAGPSAGALTGGRAPANGPGPASRPVYAAARRLADLASAARHDWLAAHLAALRAGQLTLAQLP